ncbi:DUF72 domain-containing protein [bacterium]|nr:DUF72 domain-containing protein [bacterium]
MTSVKPETALLFEEILPKSLHGKGVIQIGTSGYSFKDWRDSFYPKGLAQNQWLNFYARHFSVVEINATYYRTPSASTFQSMVDRTPEHFEFWVKVPGDVTHKNEDVEIVMKPFIEAVKPLEKANRLKGLLAQFPPSFRYNKKSLDRLVRIRNLVPDVDIAVEFRQDEWLEEGVFDFLEKHGFIHVIPDLPDLKGLPKPDIHVTSSIRYVRFHGRNQQNWYKPQLGDRYDYEYSETELREWISKIKTIDEENSTAYLFFNNCHAGQAVKNARMLRQLLEMEFENE